MTGSGLAGPTGGTADIAVIGGGIIGTAIAYELARDGASVVLFDKGPLANGTTGGSGGVVCLHDFHQLYAGFTALGYDRVRELSRTHDIGYRPWGFLAIDHGEPFTPVDDPYAREFDSGTPDSIYHRLEIGAPDLFSRYEWLRPGEISGAVLYPNQGYIHPYRITQTYARMAVATGRAEIHDGTPVLSMRSVGHRLTRLVTRRGTWDVGAVVNAGGPWGAKVAALAGVELALVPQRVQVAVITTFDDGIDGIPLTGVPERVAGENVWTRGELGGTTLVGTHHDRTRDGLTVDPDFLNRMPDAGYPAAVDEVFRRHWNLDRSEVLPGWCCVYGTTEDGFPIVSRDPDVENLWHAVGLNGHGITCHAGVAQAIAGMVLRNTTIVDTSMIGGATTSIDVAPLAADRFVRGEQLVIRYPGEH